VQTPTPPRRRGRGASWRWGPHPTLATLKTTVMDNVNNPKHYTSHPSGVECIEITEHMSFNLGNAVKYLWRASLKGAEVEDLRKAKWYVEREIKRVTKQA